MKTRIGCVAFGFLFVVISMAAQTASVDPTVTGSGKKNYIPLWLTSSGLGNSKLFQNTAGEIGVGTTTPAATLDVKGTINAATSFNLAGTAFAFGSYSNSNAFLGFAGNMTMTGTANTASGLDALVSNTTGSANTADGNGALDSNTTGSANTADGASALFSNITGTAHTAVGRAAMQYTDGGYGVTCLGYNCGAADNLNFATAIGAYAYVGQSNSLILGMVNGVNGATSPTPNVGIGTTTPSNIFTIGQGFGHAIADGWDTYSSRRWKTNIQTLHDALSKVEQLRGVSYDLKGSGKHEVGLIAEEVGAVVPEVVSYEENGKDARGVDYSRLTALLIEATKEQQGEFRQQQAELAKALHQIKQQQSVLRAQAASMRSLEAEVRQTRETLRKVQVAAAQPALVAQK